MNKLKWNIDLGINLENGIMKSTYTLKEAKPDSTQNVFLLKNPQFLCNYHETL